MLGNSWIKVTPTKTPMLRPASSRQDCRCLISDRRNNLKWRLRSLNLNRHIQLNLLVRIIVNELEISSHKSVYIFLRCIDFSELEKVLAGYEAAPAILLC